MRTDSFHFCFSDPKNKSNKTFNYFNRPNFTPSNVTSNPLPAADCIVGKLGLEGCWTTTTAAIYNKPNKPIKRHPPDNEAVEGAGGGMDPRSFHSIVVARE